MQTSDFLSLISTVMTAVAGLITAIAGIVPIFNSLQRNRANQPVTAVKDLLLKIVKVNREPIDGKVWQRLRNTTLFFFVICFLFVIVIIGATVSAALIFFSAGNASIDILHVVAAFFAFLIFVMNFVVYFYLSYLLFSLYTRTGKVSADAEAFLFRSVTMLVDAEYETLFFLCREVLETIGGEVAEYDASTGKLVANINIFLKMYSGIIKIKLEKIDEKSSTVMVKLDPHFFQGTVFALASSSWIVNQFVRQLENK
ncbi:MAG TPA: hypothetical protein VL461_04795 [Dictyobacter sp.]|jgi:hypothetical protein|nr:hypothetical protein [Dictyobacter sp.]